MNWKKKYLWVCMATAALAKSTAARRKRRRDWTDEEPEPTRICCDTKDQLCFELLTDSDLIAANGPGSLFDALDCEDVFEIIFAEGPSQESIPETIQRSPEGTGSDPMSKYLKSIVDYLLDDSAHDVLTEPADTASVWEFAIPTTDQENIHSWSSLLQATQNSDHENEDIGDISSSVWDTSPDSNLADLVPFYATTWY